MNRIILKQVVKAVRLRYPDDKFLVADLESDSLTLTSKDGEKRNEKANPSDKEYLPMLGDLLGFKTVSKIDMDLIAGTFVIHGTGEDDSAKIYSTDQKEN